MPHHTSWHRRMFLKGLAFGGAVAFLGGPRRAVAKSATERVQTQLAGLERRHGGRLGVAIRDPGSGGDVAWRGDQRFLMCSTFKLLLVAAILARVDRGSERLDRRVAFGKDALLSYAPVTAQHVGAPGMTIAALCGAAITWSDNTAANLLIASAGGPRQVTAFARSLGDPVTRLDRSEPALNRPDGDRDTTTPAAMLADLDRLLLGNALSVASRAQLVHWLLGCRTGATSLRAGVPSTWRTGDKTGSGVTATNDVAILWPPRRAPLLVAAYYDDPRLLPKARYAVLAAVGRIVAGM